jgi:hypothetical protein
MMDHNPYSPPQTEVREAPSVDAAPRPGAEAVELTLDGIALFLLFTSPAKEWFKKRVAS